MNKHLIDKTEWLWAIGEQNIADTWQYHFGTKLPTDAMYNINKIENECHRYFATQHRKHNRRSKQS